ncbi:MAG: hypothetical protein JWN19_913 [Arthrobacter sp.]|nr:hypothetical protein [Arthrobacter sp.]
MAIADDTLGGLTAFVREQQVVAGRCRPSLAQFDDSYERVCAAVDIQEVPAPDLQPRGGTALHDATARLIAGAAKRRRPAPFQERCRPMPDVRCRAAGGAGGG